MIKVIGISIWIHFIWIFVVGILLFFYTIHGTDFEGFATGSGSGSSLGSGSGSGSSLGSGSGSGSTINLGFLDKDPDTLPKVWVTQYNSSTDSGTVTSPGWVPLNIDTDRLSYQQRLPIGARLISPNRKYALFFRSGGDLILYNMNILKIVWKYTTTANAAYLFHEGQINVVNSNGTVSSRHPFPQQPTTSTLQVQDNGNLVINTDAGLTSWMTDTAVAPIVANCEDIGSVALVQGITSSDCFKLQSQLTTYIQAKTGHASTGQTAEFAASHVLNCTVQAYYDNLSCGDYIATHSDPATAPPVAPVPKPDVSVTATLNSGANIITTTSAISVSAGDMIYLGYGVDIQGPFVFQSISGTTITITKHYVGASIKAAVISVNPMLNLKQSTPLTTTTGDAINASVYPGENYIVLDSPTESLPANLSLGDLVSIQATCNPGDIDNGLTCTTYLCNVGEKVDGVFCKVYGCGKSNSGTPLYPVMLDDKDNGDGTCSTNVTFNDCNMNTALLSSPQTAFMNAYNNAIDTAFSTNKFYSFAAPDWADKLLTIKQNIINANIPIPSWTGARFINSSDIDSIIAAMKKSAQNELVTICIPNPAIWFADPTTAVGKTAPTNTFISIFGYLQTYLIKGAWKYDTTTTTISVKQTTDTSSTRISHTLIDDLAVVIVNQILMNYLNEASSDATGILKAIGAPATSYASFAQSLSTITTEQMKRITIDSSASGLILQLGIQSYNKYNTGENWIYFRWTNTPSVDVFHQVYISYAIMIDLIPKAAVLGLAAAADAQAQVDAGTISLYAPDTYTGLYPILKVFYPNDVCIANSNDPDTSLRYTYSRTIKTPSYKYLKSEGKGSVSWYIKNNSSKSYSYSKTFGPFITAMDPTTNRIMVKSFPLDGKLDDDGNFKLCQSAVWRRIAELWPFYNLGDKASPALDSASDTNIAKAVRTAMIQSTTLPLFSSYNTPDNTALPESGLLSAKLYKASYQGTGPTKTLGCRNNSINAFCA